MDGRFGNLLRRSQGQRDPAPQEGGGTKRLERHWGRLRFTEDGLEIQSGSCSNIPYSETRLRFYDLAFHVRVEGGSSSANLVKLCLVGPGPQKSAGYRRTFDRPSLHDPQRTPKMYRTSPNSVGSALNCVEQAQDVGRRVPHAGRTTRAQQRGAAAERPPRYRAKIRRRLPITPICGRRNSTGRICPPPTPESD